MFGTLRASFKRSSLSSLDSGTATIWASVLLLLSSCPMQLAASRSEFGMVAEPVVEPSSEMPPVLPCFIRPCFPPPVCGSSEKPSGAGAVEDCLGCGVASPSCIIVCFAFLRALISPSGQRWQWAQSSPFRQPPCFQNQAQGRQCPLPCSTEPWLGVPGGGLSPGGNRASFCAAPGLPNASRSVCVASD